MSDPEKQAPPTDAKPLADRLRDHFTAEDAVRDAGGHEVDPAELWGRRIARVLGVVGFLGLIYWFIHQLYFR